MTRRILYTCLATAVLALSARAETPEAMLASYAAAAKKSEPGFAGFSAARGKTLYLSEHEGVKGKVSCATCHTRDPRAQGKTRASKSIEPLAPSAAPKRFTDRAKVEKWFARNCDDVLARPCSVVEKGDFLTYLLSVE